MTTSTKVNSFTILKTKNQFILLCWKKKIMAYVHQLLDQPSQWQTFQQAGPCSVPKFTSTSITVKHLLIKNKNINQSKSSLLIWHYVSYLFLLLLCPSLDNVRETLLRTIDSLKKNVHLLSAKEKFIWLLSSEDTDIILTLYNLPSILDSERQSLLNAKL